MFSSFEFCLPTRSTSVPNSPDWIHEKYDEYRMRVIPSLVARAAGAGAYGAIDASGLFERVMEAFG